jgi:hypothetical protein
VRNWINFDALYARFAELAQQSTQSFTNVNYVRFTRYRSYFDIVGWHDTGKGTLTSQQYEDNNKLIPELLQHWQLAIGPISALVQVLPPISYVSNLFYALRDWIKRFFVLYARGDSELLIEFYSGMNDTPSGVGIVLDSNQTRVLYQLTFKDIILRFDHVGLIVTFEETLDQVYIPLANTWLSFP